jgi:uncharacterized membrane protein SpoIIM required for sporulation
MKNTGEPGMSKQKAANGNRVSVLATIFAVVLIGLASLVYTYYTPLIIRRMPK